MAQQQIRSLHEDSRGTIQCGLTSRRLILEGCEGQSDHCKRSYQLYIPATFCNKVKEGGVEELNQSGIVLPLVIAIHGFTGTSQIFSPWTDIAEQYEFVLVMPDGVQNSWNGRFCCGYALENGIDDVGFLKSLISRLSDEFTFIKKEVTYGVGHSNGAFLVTYAAHLFRAVAPLSGYQYFNDIKEMTSIVPRSVGIFQHHSQDDGVVKFNGCCTDPTMQRCCCNISNFVDQCTSAYTAFDDWANHINGCQTKEGKTLSGDKSSSTTSTSISYSDDDKGIVCYTGDNCKSNSTLCVYKNNGHFIPFRNKCPMKKEIATFFVRDSCSINGGIWKNDDVEDKSVCSCLNDIKKSRYCLSSDDFHAAAKMKTVNKPRHPDTTLSDNGLEGSRATLAFSLLTLILVVLVALRRRRISRYGGWQAVSTKELEMSSEFVR